MKAFPKNGISNRQSGSITTKHIVTAALIIVLVGIGIYSTWLNPFNPDSSLTNTTSSSSTNTTTKALKGKITLSGAFALYPLAVVWGEEFHKLHPNVEIDVSAGGAGKGMTDTLSGFADIGMISREIDPSEIAKRAYPISVAKDAVVATVNSNNPVLKDILQKGITKEMLIGIFINGTIKTWGEAVGRPEIKSPIHVYTRSDSAGAADAWAKYLGKKQENLRGIGVSTDPGLLAAVQKDTLGIGYANINSVFEIKTGLPVNGISVLPFDVNSNGKVDENEDVSTHSKTVFAIKSGAFPHPPAKVDYFVTKGNPTGITREFIKWVLTDGLRFVEENGYVLISQETMREMLKNIG